MDWNVALSAFGASLTAVGLGGAAIINVTKYYVQKEIQTANDIERKEIEEKQKARAVELGDQFELMLEAKLAEQSNDLLMRVNGTYMRGHEQRAINENVTRQMADFTGELKEMRGVLTKMHIDMAHLTAGLGRAWTKSAGE